MLFLNVIVVFCLFLACIVPYTSIASLAFISLTVPALVCINMLFVLFWSLGKKIYLTLSLTVLVYGYFTLGSFISFKSFSSSANQEDTFSIMSFNSLGFRGKNDEWERTAGDTIVKFILEQKPDIVCFQEFDYKKIRSDYFQEYPYKYVDFEFGPDNGRVIQAIYSKYKILDNAFLDFKESSNSAIYADIIVKSDTLRVYNLHLESLKIRPSYIKKERSDRLFVRLRRTFEVQQEQAKIVRKHMNDSPYRNIVCGDFNNTQFSKVYFNIKGNLKDTFLEAGRGYGETIKFWKFPFRIDMILTDPSIEVLSHKNYKINISDHEPIMATFKIPHQ